MTDKDDKQLEKVKREANLLEAEARKVKAQREIAEDTRKIEASSAYTTVAGLSAKEDALIERESGLIEQLSKVAELHIKSGGQITDELIYSVNDLIDYINKDMAGEPQKVEPEPKLRKRKSRRKS